MAMQPFRSAAGGTLSAVPEDLLVCLPADARAVGGDLWDGRPAG